MRRQDDKDLKRVLGYKIGENVRFKAGYKVFKFDDDGVYYNDENARGIMSEWIEMKIKDASSSLVAVASAILASSASLLWF